MAEVVPFSTANRERLLASFAESSRPILLKIWPDDGVAELAPEIVLRLGKGRLIGALAPGATGARALARVLISETGRIEASDDAQPDQGPGAYPPFDEALGHAQQIARELVAVIAPLGGFEAVPVLDPARARSLVPTLPPEAEVISRLVDGQRTVGAVMATAPYDERQTADVLKRLDERGVIGLRRVTLPPPVAPAAPESWDEPDEGATITRPMGHWGGGPDATEVITAGQVPFPPPQDAWAAQPELHDNERTIADPRLAPVTQTRPLEAPEPPPRRPSIAPTHDELAAAGVSDSRPLIVAVLLGLCLVLIAWWWSQPDPAPVPAPVVVAPPPPVQTPTVAATPEPEPEPPKKKVKKRRRRYSLANPPPVAGPDSDARLRQAERLLNQGRLDEAEKILSKLRRQLPNDAAVWVLSGMLEDARGNLPKAMRYTRKALKVNNRAYRGWVLKGWLEQSDRAVEDAVRSYRKALDIQPSHPMSRELRVVVKGLESG